MKFLFHSGTALIQMFAFFSNYWVIAKIKTLRVFHNHTVGFNTDSLIIKSAQHTSQNMIFLTNYILHFGIVIQTSDVKNNYEKLRESLLTVKYRYMGPKGASPSYAHCSNK